MTTQLLTEIRDLLADIKSLLTADPPRNATANRPSVATHSDNPTPADWEAYIEHKDPKNDYEIIALVVGHITKGDKKSVTKNEIIEFIRDNPHRIKNVDTLYRVIGNTKNDYRYIEFIGKKGSTYRLSVKGRQLVSKLPNRSDAPKKKKKRK